MELKIDLLGWLKRKKAKELAEERERLKRSRQIYRGQALRIQGKVEEMEDNEQIPYRT